MSSNYPNSLDDTNSLPDPNATDSTIGVHSSLHKNENAAIKAIEVKLGTGASLPGTVGQVLVSTGAGGSAWGNAPANGNGSVIWGNVIGSIANQTDLQTILNAKANSSSLSVVATSGSYTDLLNKPTIPTNNNQLTNGAGFITSAGTATTISGSIAESQVTNLTTDLAAKAPLASPVLTGTPTAPTAASSDSSTTLATTAYVKSQFAAPTWTAPTFLNGWVNYDTTTFYGAAYTKDTLGFVHLRGLVKSGSTQTAIFTLPSGYRPTRTIGFVVNSAGAFGFIQILATGDVIFLAGTNTFVYLDNIHFFPEQ